MGRVSHPVLLDRRTLMYLASDPDGSGPWLYKRGRRAPAFPTGLDPLGLDRYTSLAASADGRRLVGRPSAQVRRETLWRLRLADSPAEVPAAARISLTTSTRVLAHDWVQIIFLYVSATGTSESIRKGRQPGRTRELWSGPGGASLWPARRSPPDGKYVAFLGPANTGRTLFAT